MYGNCIRRSMINSMKIKHTLKSPGFRILVIFAIIAIIFIIHQVLIGKLGDRISTLGYSHNSMIMNLNAMGDSHDSDIASIRDELYAIKQENLRQNIVMEEQKALIADYEQHISDLENELNAYEVALEEAAPKFELPTTWEGSILTKEIGGNMGPAGRETYYNLPMQNCINKMRELGFSEEEYPYWVRDDGAKMLGKYVMIAANWKIRPLGTVIETSLGWSIVVDTGEFVADYPYGVDIAVDW